MTNIITLHQHVTNTVGETFVTADKQGAIDSAIQEHNAIPDVDDASFSAGDNASDWVVAEDKSSAFISGLAIKILSQRKNAKKLRAEGKDLLSPSDLITTEMRDTLVTSDSESISIIVDNTPINRTIDKWFK